MSENCTHNCSTCGESCGSRTAEQTVDLTKGGDIIRSRTFQAFMPLIGVAVIYLVMVMFFTWLVGILERRLRDSER